MGPADWEPRPGDSRAFNDQELKKEGNENTKTATQKTLNPFLLTCLKVRSGNESLA